MDHPLPNTPGLPENMAPADTMITWASLGFAPVTTPEDTLFGTVPAGVFIFTTTTPGIERALGALCEPITTSLPFQFEVAGCSHYAYALEDGVTLPGGIALPESIVLLEAGDTLPLPEEMPQHDLPIVGKDELMFLPCSKLDPVIVNNPLSQYSLRGQADQFERQAVQAKPLLGELCLTGQATVWYAPPNAGKTLAMLKLLSDAVADKRITPDNVYYINADDSSEGFATKIRLMDDMGCHTLAPGHKGFQAVLLPQLLHAMADARKARGALVIIDTIKKAASLMDKGKASTFTSACRAAVMAGATIVGFAHTNKQPSASGKLQYGGTSDLRDDFDAAYIMGPIEAEDFEGEKVVQFECIKSRGGNARLATYAYADTEGLSYAERLASVRLVDEEELRGFRRIEEERADAEIIAAIEACIRSGDYAKMALAKAASKRAGISERAAIRMIEKYTGTDPATARWCYERKDRGAMIYALLSPPPEQPPVTA